MRFDEEILAALLPVVHRLRDAQQAGGRRPLAELIRLLTGQIQALEENLEQLYDDQFIETCSDWVVPYIGELIGCRHLDQKTPGIRGRRAEVANTIAYRRRKGTASMLEKLAHDVTGWDARVIEFFERLATTQNINHVRSDSLAVASIRSAVRIEALPTPFENFCHLGEIRSIATRRGRYNIPNVGIFAWRLDPFSVTLSPATAADKKRYFFSPLGHNLPLVTNPVREQDISHMAEPINVPMAIRRRWLNAHVGDYYGVDKSLFVEGIDGVGDVLVCNLSDQSGPNDWGPGPPAGKVAIDPELGRLMFAKNQAAAPKVTFHYAFSAHMGGGEYDRQSSISDDGSATIIKVPDDHTSIQAALTALGAKDGVIEITDNDNYSETITGNFGTNQKLQIRAADHKRPHLNLKASLKLDAEGLDVTLNGLLISGNPIQVAGKTKTFRLLHCTLVPGLSLNADGSAKSPSSASVEVTAAAELQIRDTILGAVRLHDDATVEILRSVVDCSSWDGVAIAGSDGKRSAGVISVIRSTIIGEIRAVFLKLGCNSIFCSRVTSRKLQDGCVRFSFVPRDSRVPRRHRCQPDNVKSAGSIRPIFTAFHFGQPAYCQLASSCRREIREGADDGSEMGAFHDLFQPQRENNLQVRLEEYLRVGLEAGLLYAD